MADIKNYNDTQNFSETVNFLWGVADLIRDKFNRSDYKDVILPFTVLRRLDCVLQPTKRVVLDRHKLLEENKIQNQAPQLCRASGYVFYNISPYDFERLLADHTHLVDNLLHYINGFSENMRDVLDKFEFRNTITKLQQAGVLYKVVEKFKNADLHPTTVPNQKMGYIFEELIRKYNEALNENPGEHFTPREVIRLMTSLLLARDTRWLDVEGISRTVYDPCCGSGGMLITTKDAIQQEHSQTANIFLYGQEVNPETFAICKSDLYMKSADGGDAENIVCADTLSNDFFPNRTFDYMLSNPPYGKEWKSEQEAVEAEHDRGASGRFGAGLPRISDGQLLFLQHMLAHMKPVAEGGSRIAIVMNGSPLFTGDAGSGESEIRRWVLEHDLLETIVALPEQLFYNTGITTYIWLLTNRKDEWQRGKVQLLNASGKDFWKPMQKSLGEKRRQITAAQISDITTIYTQFKEGNFAKNFATPDFGYRKITIERPLRLNFQVSPERLARLQNHKTFKDLASDKTKKGKKGAEHVIDGRDVETNERNVETNERNVETNGRNVETNGRNVETNERNVETNERNVETNERNVETNGRPQGSPLPYQTDMLSQTDIVGATLVVARANEANEAEVARASTQQQAILAMLQTIPPDLYTDRAVFEPLLQTAIKRASLVLSPHLYKAIMTALSERDESAEVCRDKSGEIEADPELRDTENVPLDQDIYDYFAREVQPHVPDAWINEKVRDSKDGQVGKIGYEINFNRYFYTYTPPRPLADIEADIKLLEKDILAMLHEVAG